MEQRDIRNTLSSYISLESKDTGGGIPKITKLPRAGIKYKASKSWRIGQAARQRIYRFTKQSSTTIDEIQLEFPKCLPQWRESVYLAVISLTSWPRRRCSRCRAEPVARLRNHCRYCCEETWRLAGVEPAEQVAVSYDRQPKQWAKCPMDGSKEDPAWEKFITFTFRCFSLNEETSVIVGAGRRVSLLHLSIQRHSVRELYNLSAWESLSSLNVPRVRVSRVCEFYEIKSGNKFESYFHPSFP